MQLWRCRHVRFHAGVVPEGRLLMLGMGGIAALIILNELQHSIFDLASSVT